MPNGLPHPGRDRCPDATEWLNWRVVDRCCNYSAFSGYRCTPSSYSALVCLDCGARWRTNAKYVSQIRDASEKERLR